MGKRATRIAACVLAGVMAMQMTGCGNKKVDYTKYIYPKGRKNDV